MCYLLSAIENVSSDIFFSSFHRSLQSAAFLQLLLVFVAISSRMNMISIELKDFYNQADSCISCLIIASEACVSFSRY